MDESNISRLRSSWALLESHGPGLAEAFYRRLFELDPRLRDLFAVTQMDSQNEKFLRMMREVVAHADDREALAAMLAESGRRHRGYGVISRDYLAVGEAFLWALDHALPGGMAPADRKAWAEAYTFMASVMQGAAAS